MEKRTRNRIKLNSSDRVLGIVIYGLLILFSIVELYPLVFVLSASFSDAQAVSSGRMVLFPVEPGIDGYQYILQYSEVWTGYLNTILYTFVGTLINLLVTLPAAYALSRKDFRDKGLFMTVFMFTMYFSGGLIPAYLNIRDMGLLNTRTVILVSGALSVYNMIVARTFFANTIPWELHEAACIDGSSDFRMFMQIVLPLSSPIIVVLALYYGVGHWNSYFTAMIYLAKERAKWPLQLFLREILVLSKLTANAIVEGSLSPEEMNEMMRQSETANKIKYCVIVVSTVPMLIIYPFLQKFFAKGIMIGSVKG